MSFNSDAFHVSIFLKNHVKRRDFRKSHIIEASSSKSNSILKDSKLSIFSDKVKYDYDYFLRMSDSYDDKVRWGVFKLEDFKNKTYLQQTEVVVNYFKKKYKKIDLKNAKTGLNPTERYKSVHDWYGVHIYLYEFENGNFLHAVKDMVENKTEELNILNAISHPNISKVIDYYQRFDSTMKEQRIQIVTEYFPLHSLRCIFQEELWPNKNFELIRYFTAQILMAVDYLHSLKIAHRDIKPENICIDIRGYVKIIDFGAAKFIDSLAFDVLGTQFYSPLDFDKKGIQPHRKDVDIFSVGAILFEMHDLTIFLKEYRTCKISSNIDDYSTSDKQYCEYSSKNYNRFKDDLKTPEKYKWKSENIKEILLVTLIDQESSASQRKLRPSARQLMLHSYFNGINWEQLFLQTIKLEDVSKDEMIFRNWFRKLHPSGVVEREKSFSFSSTIPDSVQ